MYRTTTMKDDGVWREGIDVCVLKFTDQNFVRLPHYHKVSWISFNYFLVMSCFWKLFTKQIVMRNWNLLVERWSQEAFGIHGPICNIDRVESRPGCCNEHCHQRERKVYFSKMKDQTFSRDVFLVTDSCKLIGCFMSIPQPFWTDIIDQSQERGLTYAGKEFGVLLAWWRNRYRWKHHRVQRESSLEDVQSSEPTKWVLPYFANFIDKLSASHVEICGLAFAGEFRILKMSSMQFCWTRTRQELGCF